MPKSWPHSPGRRYECKTWKKPLSGQRVIGPIYETTSSLKRSKRATPSWFAGNKMASHQLLPAFSSTMMQKMLRALKWLRNSSSCSYTCHEGIRVKQMQAPLILTPALIGGKRSASRLGRFTHGERAPATLWIGGWVGPRASLDILGKKRAIYYPAGIQTPDPSLCHPGPSRLR